MKKRQKYKVLKSGKLMQKKTRKAAAIKKIMIMQQITTVTETK